MSKSILDSLSEAQLAALQQIFTNNGEAVVESEPAKPVSKKTGFILIRAINASSVPDDEVVTENHESDEVAYWGDESPITFGDLRFAVEDGATRSDGTKCRDYPNVWLLTQDQAYAAVQIANSFSAKPKKAAGNFKPKASAAKPQVDAEGVEVLVAREVARRMAQLGLGDQPKAETPKGHVKVPAKPVAAAPAKPVYNPGDVITVLVNGEAVELQITEDAKRLRKTVV